MASKVVSAAKSVLIGSFISKGISFISTIILARLLFPEDYGSLLLATIITGLIGQIGGMGFELYYLQFKGEKHNRERVLNQVYLLRIVTNFLLFLIQLIVGLVLIFSYGEYDTGGIIVLLGFSLLIEGFNSPQETILKDVLDFKKITIGNIFREIFGTIAKVASAFFGMGGLSFGIGPLVGSVIRYFYYRHVVNYRISSFSFDKDKLSKIFSFGKNMLFSSAGSFLVQQVDKFVLSAFFPKEIVGNYTFSWSNAAMPFNYLIAPQSQLNMSYITRFKPGEILLFDRLIVVQKMIYFIFFPVTLFLLLFVEEMVIFLFSEKWISTVPIVSVLLVYYGFQSITFPFSGVINGLGRPDINAKILIFRAFVLGPVLITIAFHFSDILIYVYSFVLISFVFDIVKLLNSFKLIGCLSFSLVYKFAIDILFVFILVSFLFIELPDINSRFLAFIVLSLLLFCFSFLFERKVSMDSIKLFLNSVFAKL